LRRRAGAARRRRGAALRAARARRARRRRLAHARGLPAALTLPPRSPASALEPEKKTASAKETPSVNIELIFGKVADHGATWVLWALLALSVGGIAIIVERSVCFWTTRDDIQSLSAELSRHIMSGHWQKAEKLLSESPSFEARVALAALGQEDPESADQLMLGASQNARLELERFLPFLGTVGSNAPFVGLLGTVVGIIGAFQQLDQSRGAWTDGLMSEIGEALIATAV